jgi:hypothetical protein
MYKIGLGYVSCVNIMLVSSWYIIIYDDIKNWVTSLTHLYCMYCVAVLWVLMRITYCDVLLEGIWIFAVFGGNVA